MQISVRYQSQVKQFALAGDAQTLQRTVSSSFGLPSSTDTALITEIDGEELVVPFDADLDSSITFDLKPYPAVPLKNQRSLFISYALKLCQGSAKGRFYVAKRRIPACTVLLREEPLIQSKPYNTPNPPADNRTEVIKALLQQRSLHDALCSPDQITRRSSPFPAFSDEQFSRAAAKVGKRVAAVYLLECC